MTWMNLQPEKPGWTDKAQLEAELNCREVKQYCSPFQFFPEPDYEVDNNSRSWAINDGTTLTFFKGYDSWRWWVSTSGTINTVGEHYTIELTEDQAWKLLRDITRHRAAVCLARGDSDVWSARWLYSRVLGTLK